MSVMSDITGPHAEAVHMLKDMLGMHTKSQQVVETAQCTDVFG